MFRYDRLDELLKSTGKKKTYLSQKIGHAGRYLNDAKKQNTDIKINEVEILAGELGTTSEYLRGETDVKEKPAPQLESELTEKQREVLRLYDSAPPTTQEVMLALLRAAEADRKAQDEVSKGE